MNEEAKKQPEEEVRSPEQHSPDEAAQDLRQDGVEQGESKDEDVTSGGGQTPPSDAPPMPPSLPMIIVLGLIAVLSGVLVVLVYEFTAPIIAEKERLALEAAVFQVVPGANAEISRQISFSLTAADGLVEVGHDSTQPANLYAVYDPSNALSGVAMEGSAQGYQDIVTVLFGYDVNKQQIVGMTILKSVDTPGLGDKKTVEKNKKFMANFEALDVALNAGKSALDNPIKTVKHGAKTKPWEVDAMSGATITSRAIAKGMNATTAELLPLLAKQLPALKSAATQARPAEPAPQK